MSRNLLLAQFGESFSFYGMRSLLILYLVGEIGFQEKEALLFYSFYLTLIEMGAPIGGFLGDKFLGGRLALLLGAGVATIGHFLFSLSDQTLLLGLGLLIVGVSLFRSNLKSVLACISTTPEKSFTHLYTLLNFGGISGALLLPFIAQKWSYEMAFGTATAGMGLSLLLLLPLKSSSKKVAFQEQRREPSSNKGTIFVLLTTLLFLFVIEEWMGSLVVLLLDHEKERLLFPPPTFTTLNPLTILILGPFLAHYQGEPLFRGGASLLALSGTLALLTLSLQENHLFLPPLLISFCGMAIAELLLVPCLFSLVAKTTSAKGMGLMMGIIALFFALASFVGGITSGFLIDFQRSELASLFFALFLLSSILGFILIGASKWFKFLQSPLKE